MSSTLEPAMTPEQLAIFTAEYAHRRSAAYPPAEALEHARAAAALVDADADPARVDAMQTSSDEPTWIVNDVAELGVLVNGRAFFLYKGESLTYDNFTYPDGTPMYYRPVEKREFGEVCLPVDRSSIGRQKYTLGDGWRPLSELHTDSRRGEP